jgi:hypothetical protein
MSQVRVGEGLVRVPDKKSNEINEVKKVRVCGPNFLYYILFLFLKGKGVAHLAHLSHPSQQTLEKPRLSLRAR